MAVAYRTRDIYTLFKEEIRKLEETPWIRRKPILVECPKCGENYSLVEQQDTLEADVERHKKWLVEQLGRTCPEHPNKFGEFN
jgi:hypothetical protein